MSEELKPCPFCGCKATFIKHSAGMPGTRGYDQWDAVACKHCRATVGACDRRFRERDDARSAWNLRVSASPPPPEDGWMDISGAPRSVDVSIILGFAPDEEGYSPTSREGFWSEELQRWSSSIDPGWKDSPQPTHWRELPPPPPAALEPKEQQ